ncbi:MAG: restriction endonuclease subunit S [Candidatus Paceibacterota bacterium]|jgi:type I restriction enzyme S subunit
MKTVITQYKNLTRWDIKSYLCLFLSPYPVEELGKYIYEHSEKVKIGNEPEKEFPILGVTNKVGVYLNEYVKGENINQPYKKVKSGELTYNPYRVNVGSIGIVQKDYDNFYISPAYVVFGTKEGLLNEYIYLVLSSGWFNPHLCAATSGSVRQNLTFDLLSQLRVPVPPIKIQEKIINEWYKAQEKARGLNDKSNKKEAEIDDYILEQLGVVKKTYDKKKGAFTISFKDLERWGVNFNSYDWNLDNLFESKKYKTEGLKFVAKINQTYQFLGKDLQQTISFVPMESVSEVEGIIKTPENRKLNDVRNGFTRFVKGDIIFAKITPCMENGKCAIAENLTNNIGIGSTEFHVLSPNKDLIDTKYLWTLLRLKVFRKSAERYFTGSAGQQRVPVNFLEEIKIPLPPLPKQREIAEKVGVIQSEVAKLRSETGDILNVFKIATEKMLKS